MEGERKTREQLMHELAIAMGGLFMDVEDSEVVAAALAFVSARAIQLHAYDNGYESENSLAQFIEGLHNYLQHLLTNHPLVSESTESLGDGAFLIAEG